MTARRRRWLGGLALGLAAALVAGAALDRLFPPELGRLGQRSTVVLDRRGDVLRAFTAADGAWRLPVRSDEVDPLYLEMLIAYEDRRFASHPGVDPLAVLRAAGQWIAHGRVVSGASTLSMQAARLLEPRPRTLGAKLRQTARAVQLELRLEKSEILDIYLELAPFGGNLEGVRAASLAYFGKEPRRLTEAEAALLVALPRSPERFRPDRHPQAARAARNEVLRRMAARGVIDAETARQAMAQEVPTGRLAFPMLAPHLTERLVSEGARGEIATTLDGQLQGAVERLLQRRMAGFEPTVGAAAVVLHNPTMELRAHVGSPFYFDERRHGMIDMAAAVRSPGSALKPFIYGLAFDRLIVHPDTVIADAPRSFGGYAPANFDDTFHGEVTVREALQRSLNVPAVALLKRVGTLAFDAALQRAGVTLRFDRRYEAATLPLALGGVGLTLEELVRLYAALSNGGIVKPMTALPLESVDSAAQARLFSPAAAWYTARILEGVAPPSGVADMMRQPGRQIGFKTGTSYGYRDAWAVGFAGDYTIGVWVGRPDGTPCLDCVGIKAAAPILFAIADLLPVGGAMRPTQPPPGVIAGPTAELPPGLRRFTEDPGLPELPRQDAQALAIRFPVDGSTLKVPLRNASLAPVALRASGGVQPLRWLVNGRPIDTGTRRSNGSWQPDGSGFTEIQVIDAEGRSASAEVFIQSVGK